MTEQLKWIDENIWGVWWIEVLFICSCSLLAFDSPFAGVSFYTRFWKILKLHLQHRKRFCMSQRIWYSLGLKIMTFKDTDLLSLTKILVSYSGTEKQCLVSDHLLWLLWEHSKLSGLKQLCNISHDPLSCLGRIYIYNLLFLAMYFFFTYIRLSTL